jgi:hypothetical protein
MTHEQIVGSVVISLVVGVFLIIIGAVLQPLLKRLWERMNAPSPLTPQTKGQLTGQLLGWEAELERLNYLNTHAKDLFLNLFVVCMASLLLLALAFLLFVLRVMLTTPQPNDLLLAFVVVVLTMAILIFGLAIRQAGRMSDARIEGTKKSVQKHIDEINKQLNPPTTP